MKLRTVRNILAFVALFGVILEAPSYLFAISGADQLISLGMSPEMARYFTNNFVTLNSTGNLVLPVASGKKLSVTVAGTEELLVDGTNVTMASNNLNVTAGNVTATAGDFISSTANKGLVLGEAARNANVTTATTAATPLYDYGVAVTQDLAAFIGGGNSANGPIIDILKTRAITAAATTIVTSGDTLGAIKFWGANGTTYDPAAAIVVKSDATPGAATDMPGSIDLQTTPDGSVTLTSALKLDSGQKATFGGIAQLASSGIRYPAATIETVAAGTSVQGDGPLTAGKFFHFVTGFDETKVVTLPACAAGNVGEVHHIMNAVTNKFAKIFPASGSQINSLGANNAYTVGVTGNGGRTTECFCQAATAWFCA
jgi:hypothetical protein